MRETGVVRFHVAQDSGEVTSAHKTYARSLLGRAKASFGDAAGAKTWYAEDGTWYRTESGPHGDTITIFVPSGGSVSPCVELEPPLGFVSQPHSDSEPMPEGITPAGATDVRPEVIFAPPSPYKVFTYKNDYRFAPTTHTKSYKYRVFDTCGKLKKWHFDQIQYGNVDWRGPTKTTLSWLSVPSRYFDAGMYKSAMFGGLDDFINSREAHGYMEKQDQLFSGQYRLIPAVLGESVFYRGAPVQEILPGGGYATFSRAQGVNGAWVVKSTNGKKHYLITVHASQFFDSTFTISGHDGVTQEKVYASLLTRKDEQLYVTDPQLIGTFNWGTIDTFIARGVNFTPWLANESGTQAVTNRYVNSPDGLYRHFINITATDTGVTASLVKSSVSAIDHVAAHVVVGGGSASNTSSSHKSISFADYQGDTLVTGVFAEDSSSDIGESYACCDTVSGLQTAQLSSTSHDVYSSALTMNGVVVFNYIASGSGSTSLNLPYADCNPGGARSISTAGSSTESYIPWVVGLDLRTSVSVVMFEYASAQSGSSSCVYFAPANGGTTTGGSSAWYESFILRVYRASEVLHEAEFISATHAADSGGQPCETGAPSCPQDENTPSDSTTYFYSPLTAGASRYAWATDRHGNVFVSFPVGFDRLDWESLGKPYTIFLTGGDPVDLIDLPGANPRFFKVGVL